MGVYIIAKKTRGVAYLYAIKTEYITLPNGKRHRRQQVLKSYGRLDKLLKQDPHAVEHLKEVYRNSQDAIGIASSTSNTSEDLLAIAANPQANLKKQD